MTENGTSESNYLKKAEKADKSDKIEEFLHLFSASQNRIYAFILSLLSNSSDADDVMQEATTIMWRKFDQFKPGTDFVAWGITIARYEVLEFRSKKKTVQFGDDVIKTLEDEAASTISKADSRKDALKKCIEKLCLMDRQMIHMRYNDNIPVKQIAPRVGKNVQNIYRSLARIHENLLQCIRRILKIERMV